MTGNQATAPNCLRKIEVAGLNGSMTDGGLINYFDCAASCDHQLDAERYLDAVDFEYRAPNILASSEDALAFDWPAPAISLDLSTLKAAEATRRIWKWLGDLQQAEVLFAVLQFKPTSLLCQLNQRNIEWVGNIANEDGFFRLFIGRRQP